MGCDGWEITAHAASAPDHEPIQGRQYSDADYTALNNSLRRRIGTLNCGHSMSGRKLRGSGNGAAARAQTEKPLE